MEVKLYTRTVDNDLSKLKDQTEKLSSDYEEIIMEAFNSKCSYDEILDQLGFLKDKVEQGSIIFKNLSTNLSKTEKSNQKHLEDNKRYRESLSLLEFEKSELEYSMQAIQERIDASKNFENSFNKKFDSLFSKLEYLEQYYKEKNQKDVSKEELMKTYVDRIGNLEKENQSYKNSLEILEKNSQEIQKCEEKVALVMQNSGNKIQDMIEQAKVVLEGIDHSSKEAEIGKLESELLQKKDFIGTLKECLEDKNKQITELEEELSKVQNHLDEEKENFKEFKKSNQTYHKNRRQQSEETLKIGDSMRKQKDQQQRKGRDKSPKQRLGVTICQDCGFRFTSRQKKFKCLSCDYMCHQRCRDDKKSVYCQDCRVDN